MPILMRTITYPNHHDYSSDDSVHNEGPEVWFTTVIELQREETYNFNSIAHIKGISIRLTKSLGMKAKDKTY